MHIKLIKHYSQGDFTIDIYMKVENSQLIQKDEKVIALNAGQKFLLQKIKLNLIG